MTIKKVSGGEIVVSHTGKRLTKPKSHAGAVKDLRRIEYFKHHAKCIVDPSLVKAAEIGSAMQQYSPVVFQTKGNQKKDEIEADKKDFPSTAKAFDLQNTLQRDFPSTAEHDMTIADAFANPLAGEKSWNGPDVQMKGSDYIQSHKRTTKSVTIAGRKIRLVKGSEGSNNMNLVNYPMDKGNDSRGFGESTEQQKRHDFFNEQKMKEKVKSHDEAKKNSNYTSSSVLSLASRPDGYLGRSKNSEKIGEYSVESPDRTKVYKRAHIDPNKPHTVSLIHYSPEALAKKEKRAKNKISLKSKIGNIVLQYTQNQPLAAGFKPLIGYLTQTEDPDEKETEKAMTTSQIAEKIGTPKKVAPSSASRIRLMERAAKEKTEETTNEPGPHPDFSSTGGYRGNPAKLGKSDNYKNMDKDYGSGRKKLGEEEAISRDINRRHYDQYKTKNISERVEKEKAAYRKETKPKSLDSIKPSETSPIRPSDVGQTKQSEASQTKASQGYIGKSRPNPIDGGIGDDLQYKDVDQQELTTGIDIEQEHVGNDPNIDEDEKKIKGADIAMDHLKEDPKYYTHLTEMERSAKAENKAETNKKKLMAINEVGKSVIKERKLAGTVANAEKMVDIRESTGASPSEMKTTVGQLRAYTAKLKAEREKNKGLISKALLREERDPSSKAYKKLQREQKVKDRGPKEYEKREKVFND